MSPTTSISTANTSWSIGYDANGNRTTVTLNATASNYTTAATSNRLTGISNPARSFSYDNAGNTTQDTNPANSYSATYDLGGRLATLTRAGVTTTYTYDNEGKRLRKASSSGAAATVAFVYDLDGHLLGEYDQNGTPLREYAWLQDTPVAVFTPDPANAANAPIVYFIHTDHLGAPRMVLDKAGNQRWNWLAEPVGTSAPNTNPAALGAFSFPLRFPGQYADAESGLSYNMNRLLDISISRYTQSDPIGLNGGINTYAYAGGNPVSFKDPSGLVAWSGTVGSGGIIDGLGAALFTFDLTSECKCGVKVHIKGYVPTVAAGLGLKYTANSSPALFTDVFPCPKTDIANGWAGAISATSVVGGGGSWGAMRIGSLSSGWPSLSGPVFGLDISAGVFVGRGVVTSAEVTKCDDCEAAK